LVDGIVAINFSIASSLLIYSQLHKITPNDGHSVWVFLHDNNSFLQPIVLKIAGESAVYMNTDTKIGHKLDIDKETGSTNS
jgi:hypothetical protein